MNLRSHWQHVFETRDTSGVSWYQEFPKESMGLIRELSLVKQTPIIEIGGGDSRLGDALLEDGYKDITIVDISEKAIETVAERLKGREEVKLMTSDVLDLELDVQYGLWHDRASFHFITDPDDILKYKHVMLNHLAQNGMAIVATFAVGGPDKCSNLPVQQYNERAFRKLFELEFEIMRYHEYVHVTPKGAEQNFAWVCMKKR